jgi:hypothetical protein
MKNINFEDISFEVDYNKTKKFYEEKNNFTCQCSDCLNYISNLNDIKNELKGIDIELGIDVTKNVGKDMDELMHNDYNDFHLFVAPYYVFGKFYVDGVELKQQNPGPIWPSTIRCEKKLSKKLSLIIINTSGKLNIEDNLNTFTIWIEYKFNPIKNKIFTLKLKKIFNIFKSKKL